jgi:hypothetical protein
LTFPNRSIMVSFIILLSLVSVACGELRIGVSAGDASGSSGYTETLGAKINDQIYESTTLAGSTLSQSFKSSGYKTETFSVTNNAGDHAEVGFDIKNSNSYSGSYTLSPQTAKYAQSTEKLDVNAADSIYTFAYASTRDRYENAFLSLSITDGSLVGYSNSAYATLGQATVKQGMQSASGESIWVNEKAGKGLNYNDLDYFVGDGPYSPNPNNGLPDYYESATATNNLAQTNGVILTTYSGSATATNKMAEKKRTIGSFSASSNTMYWPSYAYNRNGESNSLIEISNGQLSKYTMTTTATQTATKTSVNINSAQGSSIDAQSNAESGILGSRVASHIENGNINGYTTSATTTNVVWPPKTSVDSRQKFTSASGTSLSFSGNANKELDGLFSGLDYSSTTNLNIDGGSNKGSVKGYENSAITEHSPQGPKIFGSATTSQNIKSASGSLIDVKSHAENKRKAYEGHWDTSTTPWTFLSDYNPNFGSADFQLVRSGSLTANVKSVAKSDDIDITVTGLPAKTKTAMMLEPFAMDFVNNHGAADMKTTVFTTLVNKGYATTRYTDSAADEEKFTGLGKYNVVLVNSHMSTGTIALSTSDSMSDAVTAKELVYKKTTSPTLVILTGCDSFVPASSMNYISSKVQKADLSAGYEKSVDITWMSDNLNKIFQNMGTGMTFSEADSDAWNNYLPNVWFPNHYPLYDPTNPLTLGNCGIWRLSTYGNTGFKL